MTAGSSEVKAESCVKLLGVYIDQMLSFGAHIGELCQKAGRKLSVLARLSKTLDLSSKMLLFHAFTLSHFEYS